MIVERQVKNNEKLTDIERNLLLNQFAIMHTLKLFLQEKDSNNINININLLTY